MTLVVAETTPSGVWLSGDMRVTDCSAAKLPGFARAALKLIIVNPTLCIGYAGRVGAANMAIEHVHAEQMTPGETADYLLEIHRPEKAVDFVVASLDPPGLVQIKDGTATETEEAWIGDPDAFAAYERLYEDDPCLPPAEFELDESSRVEFAVAVPMNDAMQALVISGEDPDSPATIGEAVVTVGPEALGNGFEYHVYSNLSPGHAAQSGPKLLSTEHGSFSLAFQVPSEPGIGAVAIYFEEGGFGILYSPLLTNHPEEPESVSGATAQEFREAVQERYGLSLRGSGWKPN